MDTPDRLGPSSDHTLSIDAITLVIGPLKLEEFDYKLKGFTFIVIGDRRRRFPRYMSMKFILIYLMKLFLDIYVSEICTKYGAL